MVMKRIFTYDMLYVKYPSRANLSHWNYVNETLPNGETVTVLCNYKQQSTVNDLDVPNEGTILNSYYNSSSTSGCIFIHSL